MQVISRPHVGLVRENNEDALLVREPSLFAVADGMGGHEAGEVLDFGGLLGTGPIMKINRKSSSVMIQRGGRIPAPMQSLKN